MRLKSEIWVKAYIRRCMVNGAPAVVVRRGQGDGGAIYIKVNFLDGRVSLYGPAPAGLEEMDSERRWAPCGSRTGFSEAEAAQYLERQIDFDPDIWIVEVEDRAGRHFLEGVLFDS